MSDQETDDIEIDLPATNDEAPPQPKIPTEQIKTGLGLSPEDWWMNHSARGDWARGRYFQRIELERSTPQMKDALWADGWRHFGTTFFRDYFNIHGQRLVRVLPLRIRLSDYRPKRDHRRLMKRNQDLDVSFRPILITPEHNELFKRHAKRFVENRPPSLYSFISLSPVLIPCASLMCEVRDGDRLLAVSFFDVGHEATSSIYAMFEPDASARGLGHYTLLCELQYALQQGKEYVYTGYAHKIPSYYDYKKRYRGTEFYDWRSRWRGLDELTDDLFPTHRYEISDIPEELLRDDSEEDELTETEAEELAEEITEELNEASGSAGEGPEMTECDQEPEPHQSDDADLVDEPSSAY